VLGRSTVNRSTVSVSSEHIAPTVPVRRLPTRRGWLLAGQADQPRARRATDVILLLCSLAGLAFLGAVANPQPGTERSFTSFVGSLPSGLDGLWRLMIAVLAAWSVVVVLATVIRHRWRLLYDVLLAAAVATCGSLLFGRVVVGSWPAVWDSLRSAAGVEYFPPLGIAVPAAVAITAQPHLIRPVRWIGRWCVAAAFLGEVLHGTATPTGAAAGVLIAAASAAVVHLLFGSSVGRPNLDDVASALTRLGIPAHSLRAAERQAAGVFTVEATDDQGNPLLVRVYGRDAHDTQLLTTAWRKLWYREAGSPGPLGRLPQAEHEALLTVMAGQASILTDRAVMVCATDQNDVLLVLRRIGEPLDEAPDRWDEFVVAEAWRTLRRLHDIHISHGQVDSAHLIMDGTRLGFVDFRGGLMAPSAQRVRTDQAQLLVTSAVAVGVGAAVTAANVALESDELAATLPYVQAPALTADQRRVVSRAGLDLDDLRQRAAHEAGVATPELERLRRVTVWSALQMALLVLAFLALASGIGSLDLQELAEQVKNATWWLIVAGALLAQTPRFTSALSVMGASPVPLPLGPVYALQLATSYIALAVPATAARVAINIRFFQRHGLPPGSAVAIGALDGVAQFVVQLLLLIGTLILTSTTLHLSFDSSAPSNLGLLVLILLAGAAAIVITVALVPKWRRFCLDWIRRLAREAWAAVQGLHSPRRLTLLFGGNLATELLFAIALQTFVRGFGYHVGLGEVVLINVSVSLLSGVLPIPGGIGVVEGGLSYGLVRAGVPEEVAFAAVLLYRLATFYLPPIWGFFALRWLERTRRL
jgi:glycosyltransferase 2 family protein